MAERHSGDFRGEAGVPLRASPRKGLRRAKPLGWFPYLILGVGVVLSLLAWRWTVTLEIAARPETAAQAALPLVLLASGIVASLLLAGLAWTLSTSRDHALQLATRMTDGL